MDKNELIFNLKKEKIVAVIRMDETKVIETVDAIIEGGINFIEITCTMDNALELISSLDHSYKDNKDVVIGAGTVLDVVTARIALLSGAKFIVSPIFNEEIAKLCNLYRVPYIPGVQDSQGIDTALRSGSDILKLFPASIFNSSNIKDYKGPFPQAEFMISGKVNKDNINEWLDAGSSIVCLGSALTNQIEKGADAVVATTREYKNIIK